MSRSQSHTDDTEAEVASTEDQETSVAPSFDELDTASEDSDDVFSGFGDGPIVGDTTDNDDQLPDPVDSTADQPSSSTDVPEPESDPEPSDSLADLFADPDPEDTQPDYDAQSDEYSGTNQTQTKSSSTTTDPDEQEQPTSQVDDSAGQEGQQTEDDVEQHIKEEQQRRQRRQRSRQQKYDEILSGTEQGPRLRGSSDWKPTADSETLPNAQPRDAEAVLDDDVAAAIESIDVDSPGRPRNVFQRLEPPTTPAERLRNAVDTALTILSSIVITSVSKAGVFVVGSAVLLIAAPLLLGARLLKPALPYITGVSLFALGTCLIGTWVTPTDIYGAGATLNTQIEASLALTGILGGTALIATILESRWDESSNQSFDGILG